MIFSEVILSLQLCVDLDFLMKSLLPLYLRWQIFPSYSLLFMGRSMLNYSDLLKVIDKIRIYQLIKHVITNSVRLLSLTRST